MNILILTSNTGEGHNSVAAALQEKFEYSGDYCLCVDALALESERVSSIVSSIHTQVYIHLPKLYGACYRKEESNPLKTLEQLLSKAARNLKAMILSENIDAVICVHVFGALILNQTRHKYGCIVPAFFVATDYTCSPYVNRCDMDGFFIPHQNLVDEFCIAGIDRTKLIISGIPVRKVFYKRESRTEARAKLGLPEHGMVVLIASGSIGCGPIEELFRLLSDQMPENSALVVICGHNTRLYERLCAMPAKNQNQVIGFTKRMEDYMDAADVYTSKAGGVSTTEALAKGVPLLLINAIQGCESHNFRFMTENNLAVGASSAEEAADFIFSNRYIIPNSHEGFIVSNSAQLIRHVVLKTIEHQESTMLNKTRSENYFSTVVSG